MTRDDIVAALERAASEDYLYEPDVKLLRALADALEQGRVEPRTTDWSKGAVTHVWIIPEPKVKP